MNTLVESLNLWGARFIEFAPVILWQSSLLMALIFIFDFAMQRKIRPAVRYALWFVVFIKLLVPPTLALPTGAAWWLRSREVVQQPARIMRVSHNQPAGHWVQQLSSAAPLLPQEPPTSPEAWLLLAALGFSGSLFAWAIFRWWQIAQRVRKTATASDALLQILESARQQAHVGKHVSLRLTEDAMSPAVCGLFRPVILLPQSLVERLTEKQLRAVLLHELIHLRRGDVWVNCAQTLLQIVYWWHPLLWFANARVRRLREESVDDAVMVALNEDAEIYAPTLLEVAKLAFNRPLAALGLVGILESRNALRYRIERLLNFSAPRRTGLSVVSIIGITAFTALAVPMGEPPARVAQSGSSEPAHAETSPIKKEVLIEAQFYQVGPDGLGQIKLHSESLHHAANSTPWCHLLSNDVKYVRAQFKKIGVPLISSPRIQTSDNVPASLFVGDGTNNIQWDCSPLLHDNEVDLTTLARTTGKYAPDGKGWPDLGDKTNCAIYARMNIPSGDGVLLLAEHPGTASHDNLILILTAKIIDPSTVNSNVSNGATSTITQTNQTQSTGLVPTARTNVIIGQNSALSTQSTYTITKLNEQLQAAMMELNDLKVKYTDEHPRVVAVKEKIEILEVQLSRATGSMAGKLHTRTFTGLDMAKLDQKLKRQGGFTKEIASSEATTDIQTALVNYFKQSRVADLQAPKSVLFNYKERTLTVCATAEELTRISAFLSSFDYDLEFPAQATAAKLHTRTFKVNMHTFFIGGYQGGAFTNQINRSKSSAEIQSTLVDAFRKAGVDLSAPKSLFFNDSKGSLTINATDADLNLLEDLISKWNAPPPEITIKVRFVEVEPNFALAQGFDWYLGPPDHEHPWPSMATLNAQQFRTVLKTLKDRNGATLLSEGEVTTLSGREAQLEFTDAVTNANKDVITKRSMIDLLGTVTPDGEDIQMYLNPILDLTLVPGSPSSPIWPTGSNSILVGSNSIPVMTLLRVLPPGRVVSTPTNCVVGDGQTIMLGNFRDSFSFQTPERISKTMDFFEARQKRLLVFVTPTIIDASGNRVHSKDYYDGPIY